MQLTIPQLLDIVFARNNDQKNVIPDTNTNPTTQNASWSDGFPGRTMIPRAAGGLPPLGQDFNGIFNALSDHTVFQNIGGHYRFDATFATKIGGYPKDVILQTDDGISSYRSLVDNNLENFNTASPISNWEAWAGQAKSGLPPNPQDNYVVTWDEALGEAVWKPAPSMPIGSLGVVPPNSPGWIDLNLTGNSTIPVNTYPDLVAKKYVGDDANATAGWFYRCDDVEGNTRNTTGAYFVLPGLREYFIRCGVADWVYHQDQIQNITGSVHPYLWNSATDATSPDWQLGTGALFGGNPATVPWVQINSSGSRLVQRDLFIDASRVARTGTETNPKFIYENIAIKAYDVATNQTAIDIAYVINQIQSLQTRVGNRKTVETYDPNVGGSTKTLTPSDCGKTIIMGGITGGAGQTITVVLPLSSACDSGSTINLGCSTQNQIFKVVCQSGDHFGFGNNSIAFDTSGYTYSYGVNGTCQIVWRPSDEDGTPYGWYLVNTGSIGEGQTWKNVTASRSPNVWLQNTFGRTIAVNAVLTNSSLGSYTAKVDVGASIDDYVQITGSSVYTTTNAASAFAIVPPGFWYRVGISNNVAANVNIWVELS